MASEVNTADRTGDRHLRALDGSDVHVVGVRENDFGAGALHDLAEVLRALAEDDRVVLGGDLEVHLHGDLRRDVFEHELDQPLGGVHHVLVLLLAALHEDHRRVQLRASAEDDLHAVLLLHLLHERRVVVVRDSAGNHDGKFVGDEQRRRQPHQRAGLLHPFQRPAQRHLIRLLRRIRAVRVGEVNVRLGFVHDAFNVVAASSDDVTVVSVRHIHLHDHAVALNEKKNFFW